jgi:tetrahydromethanopterin S-methyltransferase subunit F
MKQIPIHDGGRDENPYRPPEQAEPLNHPKLTPAWRRVLQRIWAGIVAGVAGLVIGLVVSIAMPHSIDESGKMMRYWITGAAIGIVFGLVFGGPKKVRK